MHMHAHARARTHTHTHTHSKSTSEEAPQRRTEDKDAPQREDSSHFTWRICVKNHTHVAWRNPVSDTDDLVCGLALMCTRQ
jgi:hypothetical protein